MVWGWWWMLGWRGKESGIRFGGLRHQLQLRKGDGIRGETGALTQPFIGEEAEILVFADGSAEGAAILLATVVRLGLVTQFGEVVVGLECLATKEGIEAAVEIVGAGLGDDVECGTLTSSVCGREAVGADIELLHRFERQLHDGAADRIVFVVDAVYGGIGVASARTIDGIDGVAVLGGVVAIDLFHAGRQNGEVGEVPAIEREVLYLGGRDRCGNIGLLGVDQLVPGGDLHGLGDCAGLEWNIGGKRGADQKLQVLDLGGTKPGGIHANLIAAGGEQIEAVLAGGVGSGLACGVGCGIRSDDSCTGNGCACLVCNQADDAAGCGCLSKAGVLAQSPKRCHNHEKKECPDGRFLRHLCIASEIKNRNSKATTTFLRKTLLLIEQTQ
jgi:hypothetical protein